MHRTMNLMFFAAMIVLVSGCGSEAPTETKEVSHRDLSEAFKEGFKTRVRHMERERNEKDLAKTQSVASLESLSADEFREAWQTDIDATNEPARDVLSKVLVPLGWMIVDSEGVSQLLDQRVTIRELGVPRLKVVEEVCRMIGVTPEYPNPLKGNFGGGFLGGFEALARQVGEQTGKELPDAQEQMTLRKTGVTFTLGKRDSPVTYAGPFMIRVGKLQEYAPETTGRIELIAYAPGLPLAVESLNDFGRLNITSVTSAKRKSMKDGSGGSGFVGGFPWISMEAPIHGLLRDVSAMTVSGNIQVDIPTRVESFRFEKIEEGAVQSTGAGSVAITKVRKSMRPKFSDSFSQPKTVPATQVTLDSNPPRDLFHSTFWLPVDDQGNVLQTSHQGYDGSQSCAAHTIWGDPTTLVIKDVLQRETLSFDFELDVQLNLFSQQPESIASLDFGTHDAPMLVEVLSVNHEGSFFPKVHLKCINHSNKEVDRFEYTLRYLNADGREAGDHSSSTSCEIPPNEAENHEVDALSMRDKSLDVAILLRQVIFKDQSTWTANPSEADTPYAHAKFVPPVDAEGLFYSYRSRKGSGYGPINHGMLFQRRISLGRRHYFFLRRGKLLASRWVSIESDSGSEFEVQIPDESDSGKLIVDLDGDATIERIGVMPMGDDSSVVGNMEPYSMQRWSMPLQTKGGEAELALYAGTFRIFGASLEEDEVILGTRYRDILVEPGSTISIDSLEWFTDKLDRPVDQVADSFHRLALRRYRTEIEHSLRAVNRAIEFAPENDRYYRLRSSLHRTRKNFKASLADIDRAIELAPDSASHYRFRGEILRTQNDVEAALADFGKAVELDPKNPFYVLDYAKLSAGLKQYEQVRECITRVLLLAEDHDKTAHINNSVSWMLSSTADLDLRDSDTALRAAKRAVELEENMWTYWNTLGVAQYRAEKYRSAINSLQKSVELSKREPASLNLFFLAMAHWQLGDREEAQSLHAKGIDWMESKQPTNEELIRFREEVEQMLAKTMPVKARGAANEN